MARNIGGPMRSPGDALGRGAGGSPGAATAKARKAYLCPPSPGAGTADPAGSGGYADDHPGEHRAGLHFPRPEGEGGAAEAMVPHDPYGEGDRSRRNIRRGNGSGGYG